MEANVDGSGSHWHASRQAAQHRLHGVALRLLALEGHLLLELHRFMPHVTLWKSVKIEGKQC